jgi:hypothetical protein
MRESTSPFNINIHTELRYLKSQKWVDENNQLQPKAITLIDQVESFFKVQKTKTSNQLMGEDFTKNIETYNNLFPSGKLGSGKYAKCNPKNLEEVFRWFFKEYGYSWETILKGTHLYIQESSEKYMQTSRNFVRKYDQNSKVVNSELANICWHIENGTEGEELLEVCKAKVV